MKQPETNSHDELQAWRDWAEAEYCPKCGGKGENPIWVGFLDVEWVECDRCNGTGRA